MLIIIGAILVVAVYILTTVKRRREANFLIHRQFSRSEIPDVILRHDEGHDGEALREREASTDSPSLGKGNVGANGSYKARLSAEQPDMFAGICSPESKTVEAYRKEEKRPSARSRGSGDGLVAVYICPRKSREFKGIDLVKALNGVGMYHGDMGIFHHFGEKNTDGDEPVFSAASMLEPGSFNLLKIDAFRTGGLVLFMRLPGVFDGSTAFNLLLDTAERLSALLDGELLSDPYTPLDAENITTMRNYVAEYGDA